MDTDEKGPFAIGCLISTIFWLVVLVCLKNFVDWNWQQLAIQHGAAEWQVDSQTGETTFTWLTKPEAGKESESDGRR